MSVPFVLTYTHTFSTVQYICTLYELYVHLCMRVYVHNIHTYVCTFVRVNFTAIYCTYLMQAMLLMMWSLAERLRDSTLSWRRGRSPTAAGSLTTWTATGWRWTAPPPPPLQLTELEDDWRLRLQCFAETWWLGPGAAAAAEAAQPWGGLRHESSPYAATRCRWAQTLWL